MIRIVIAEDHQALIDGIKLMIEFESDIEVVGEANDGEELIEIVKLKKPDIVLTDIRMPKCDGICATKAIMENFSETKVIGFSMFEQTEAISQMQTAGAKGYILKNSSLKKVLEAIRTVAKGGIYFDDAITTHDWLTKEEIILSKREKEILQLIGEGKTSQEIADTLFIGKTTVDTHRKNIIKKINIHGKTDLIRFAVERKYDF
ncbi:MAG: DNA-binding response regulator [Bacteroidetes bacterium HGW-Bacteroidetes-23]|uniref:Response regulator transcription factor n=1 Tax=Flavobacterium azooxidireducens TaxID=1871076 RepID=A0ABY4KDG3_9FLAO|nr:response regulator transcription factor [Flavobacterium azooxidireducens]PKP16987.1 MAG: DNA-binding response regulator [Bacteroidetes bacterium HGW-Bacteroidetes-23]UPQ78584.1 response regulator transcription factor [Flavobacterium azooxidireducens]